jgi:hypothetical protein
MEPRVVKESLDRVLTGGFLDWKGPEKATPNLMDGHEKG